MEDRFSHHSSQPETVMNIGDDPQFSKSVAMRKTTAFEVKKIMRHFLPSINLFLISPNALSATEAIIL